MFRDPGLLMLLLYDWCVVHMYIHNLRTCHDPIADTLGMRELDSTQNTEGSCRALDVAVSKASP